METYGVDTGLIVAAVALLAACIALARAKSASKPQGDDDPDVLYEILKEVRNGDATLGQMNGTLHHQHSAMDRIAATLEAMRQSADDHASDVKSGIGALSGAVDAARTEAGARDEALGKRIDEARAETAARDQSMVERINNAGAQAAEARENAADANLTAGGLRKDVNGLNQYLTEFPKLRGAIDALQQDIAAITESTAAIPELGAAISGLQENLAAIVEVTSKQKTRTKQKKDTPRAGNRRGRTASTAEDAPKETPPSAEAQPGDGAKIGAAGNRTGTAPGEKAAAAAAAQDPTPAGATAGDGAPGDKHEDRQEARPTTGTAETGEPEGDGSAAGRADTRTDIPAQPVRQTTEPAGSEAPETGHAAEPGAAPSSGAGTKAEPAAETPAPAGNGAPDTGDTADNGEADAGATARAGTDAGKAPPAGARAPGAGQQTEARP